VTSARNTQPRPRLVFLPRSHSTRNITLCTLNAFRPLQARSSARYIHFIEGRWLRSGRSKVDFTFAPTRSGKKVIEVDLAQSEMTFGPTKFEVKVIEVGLTKSDLDLGSNFRAKSRSASETT
jgi:hypothetical protein